MATEQDVKGRKWTKAHAGFERKRCVIQRRAGRPLTIAENIIDKEAHDLIAAAPTMLEALKRLVAERDNEPERYPLDPTCNQCTEGLTPIAHDRGLCHWHEARAAIAKAEGCP